MQKKYTLVFIALIFVFSVRAQQASRLIGLTKTAYNTTAAAFLIEDTAAYMYHGTEDTTNGGGLAFDSSYTFAYTDSITVNNQSYRSYQTLVNNNLTVTLTQWYDTLANGWKNYTLNNATFNTDSNVTLRVIQTWDSVGLAWVNSTYTANTYAGANLTVKLRQNWLTTTNAWRNNLKDSFAFDGNNNTIYHRQQSWDTINNVWVNSTLVTFSYNGMNQETEAIHQAWNATGSSWTNSVNDLLHYNVQNLLQNTIEQRLDSVTNAWRNYGEDSLIYNGTNDIGTEYKNIWDTVNNLWRNVNLQAYTYDASHNNLTDTMWTWNNNNSVYKYNGLNTYTYNTFNQVLVYTTFSWSTANQVWVEKNTDLQYRYYYQTFTDTVSHTGVENIVNNTTLSVYPVPAESQLNVILNWGEPQAFTMGIYDISGNLVRQWGCTGIGTYKQTISVSDLAPGNYFIKATGSKQQIIQKFVIVR